MHFNQPLVEQRLVDQRLVDQRLLDQRLVDQRLLDQQLVHQRLVRNVRGPTCHQTGGEQRWSKILTTAGWPNHLGHLWCCDFDDDGSPND